MGITSAKVGDYYLTCGAETYVLLVRSITDTNIRVGWWNLDYRSSGVTGYPLCGDMWLSNIKCTLISKEKSSMILSVAGFKG